MSTVITSIDPHSPAEKAGITVGEQLLEINGHKIVDVLDYRFYGYDPKTVLRLHGYHPKAGGAGSGPEFSDLSDG